MMEFKRFIIVALLHALGESSCPRECSCVQDSVLCIQKNLEKVPNFDDLSESPIIIDLSGNKISFINEDDFSFMENNGVKEIYLNNSEILDIESSAFEELENLQELYLGENLLSSIPDDLIEELPDMILLELSRNHFSGSMPIIKSNSLEVLALANAKILSVPPDALKYLPNLKMLLLQENNLKTINPGVFSYVGKKTFFLKMSYNPWECSCENMKLFQFLDDNKFIDKSDPYHCWISTSSSELVNLYDKNAINSFQTKCRNNRIVTRKTQENINIEVNSTTKNSDKSYSLVKDSTNMHNVSSIDTSQVVVEDKEFKSTKCEKIEQPSILFNVSQRHVEIILIASIFAVGFGVGCCLNQFLSITRYSMLKPVDGNFNLFTA